LIILDRTFDFLSPLLHDYYYESTIYDFYEVGEEGEITLDANSGPKQ